MKRTRLSSMRTYTNTELGISLDYPESWSVQSLLEMADIRARMAKGAGGTMAQVMTHAQLPLLALFKYPQDHDDVNPAIQLTARKLSIRFRGTSAREVAKGVMAVVRSYPDAQFKRVYKFALEGVDAVRTSMQYTIETDVGAFPVAARLLVVVRGDTCFQLGLSGKQNGPDACGDLFDQVLASVRVEP